MRDLDISTLEPDTKEDASLRISDLLVSVGFSAMLAWHYLVLFSPVFNGREWNTCNLLFQRQLTLYLALAATFTVIGAVSFRATRRNHRLALSRPFVIGAGIAAVASSALCTVLMYLSPGNTIYTVVAFALLGSAEAVLMFTWLNCFVSRFNASLLHTISVDMIAGGFIALVICHLQWPWASIAAIFVPGFSAVILAHETPATNSDGTRDSEIAQDCEDDNAQKASSFILEIFSPASNNPGGMLKKPLRNRYMIISVSLYALAFGLLQGSFAIAGITLLMADNAVVLLGIVLAGITIWAIPERFSHDLSVDVMHRLSLLLFVAGAVGIAWFYTGDAFVVAAQIAILAGFNLFDLGVMTYGMESKRTYEPRAVHVLDGFRPIVYTCLAIGLVIGSFATNVMPTDDLTMALVMICGIAIIVLVASTLLPYVAFGSSEITATTPISVVASESSESREIDDSPDSQVEPETQAQNQPVMPDNWVSPWKSACTQIAKLYQLSRRETEIFFLLAKGRNAEYIQQNLVISTHTAKTHIANIYRKLEVHSLQELLDLVEAFRDAERRLAETEEEQGN